LESLGEREILLELLGSSFELTENVDFLLRLFEKDFFALFALGLIDVGDVGLLTFLRKEASHEVVDVVTAVLLEKL
jgi:hypothetical protein